MRKRDDSILHEVLPPEERAIEVWRDEGATHAMGSERAVSSAIDGFALVPAQLFAPPRA